VSDTTQNAPAGWYPDPAPDTAPGRWDGTQWTEHVGVPATQPSLGTLIRVGNEGTKPYTPWIWIITLLPLLGPSSFFLIDWTQILDSSTSTANPYASLAIYSDPGYLISTAISWISYALTVVFAFLDVRELKKRGVPQPFHWAFAFIPWSLVYVIGRSVVAKRRTGSGMAPVWVSMAIIVVFFIASIALGALMVNYVIQTTPSSSFS